MTKAASVHFAVGCCTDYFRSRERLCAAHALSRFFPGNLFRFDSGRYPCELKANALIAAPHKNRTVSSLATRASELDGVALQSRSVRTDHPTEVSAWHTY